MRTKNDDDLKPSMKGRKPAKGPNLRIMAMIERMHGKPPRVGSTMYVRLPPPSNQLAVVVNSKHGMAGAENHARYIEREGAGENGERPISFSHDEDEVKAVSVVREWEEDEVHYRRVLPLMSENLDPKAYAKGYIAKLEKDFKMPPGSIHYVASVHNNTAQTHVHLMIRGRDHLGRKLDICENYAHNIEWRRASDVATELAGPRSYQEIAQSVKREQERYEQGMCHPELGLNDGWKLVINVNRSRNDPATKAVMQYMRDHKVRYDMSFATKNGEVLTASMGSYDRMMKAARELEEKVGKDLDPIQHRYVIASGIVLNDSMTAKFIPKNDRDFSNITPKGIPILKEHAKEIKHLPPEQKMALAHRHRDHADRELMERYGEFYGGKERTSALERLHSLKREEHQLGL
jgi:hypothetical protein